MIDSENNYEITEINKALIDKQAIIITKQEKQNKYKNSENY